MTLIKVRATAVGIYNDHRYEPGDVFYVDPEFFADVNSKFGWMEKVEEKQKGWFK